jgi:tRNA threonylcarbamoyladenosine biosynthesis protein TsaE
MKDFVVEQSNLQTVVQEITAALPLGGIVLLRGDLAAGKTTLVSAFGKAFAIDEAVTSPTFALQQCYGDNIFHYDIYNHGIGHFMALGMLEELEKEGYHFIEWADEALEEILKKAYIPFLIIEIQKLENKRMYRVDDAHVKS